MKTEVTFEARVDLVIALVRQLGENIVEVLVEGGAIFASLPQVGLDEGRHLQLTPSWPPLVTVALPTAYRLPIPDVHDSDSAKLKNQFTISLLLLSAGLVDVSRPQV